MYLIVNFLLSGFEEIDQKLAEMKTMSTELLIAPDKEIFSPDK